MRVPHGFVFDPAKWSVVISDTGNYTKSSPDSATYYNLGSISISVPIGMWALSYAVAAYDSNSSATIADVRAALSTSASSVSDTNLLTLARITCPTGANQSYFLLSRTTVASIAAKTTYYLIEKASVSGATTLGIAGAVIPTKIEAVCAYL
jgi:hypothetical protein